MSLNKIQETKIKQFYRKPIYKLNENVVQIQTLEWDIFHDSKNKIIIRAFGVTEKSESVVVNISNFNPFFYIKLPEYFTQSYVKLILDYLKSKLPKNLKNGIVDDSCEIVSGKSFFGYSEKDSRFLKLVFSSDLTKSKCSYFFKFQIFLGRQRILFELFETKIESILRFFHVTGILPCGILSISNFDLIETRNSNTQLEFTTNIFNVKKIETEERYAFLQVSFDIETFSIDNTFPKPTIPENVITHIGSKWTWSDKKKSHLDYLVSLNCNKINDKTIHFVFDSEKELLKNFIENFKCLDPDIIYQYNGDSFDWNYIAVRCKKYNIDLNISKIKFEPAYVKQTEFSSSAYGTTRYNRLIIPGRINFDILIFMQREFKENSYKLNDISLKYLGKEKDPITVSDIFNSYRNKDLELSKQVGMYCLQDSLLPQLLVEHFYIIENQIGMSNVTLVPFTFLFTKGQEIKAFSQILNKTLLKNYIVPDAFEKKTDEKFTGATVMTPETGGYFDYPVAVLDFEGLYPSIMMAHNLCYSSYIKGEQKFECETKTFEWTDVHGHHKYAFAQNTDSVLTELLLELKNSRNVAKRLKKESTGILQVIYDKRQLAYKVSMNSIYGFLTAYKMHCKPIGATVTFIGREMIKDTASNVIKNYPKSSVIYGDSVAHNTPVLVKIDNVVQNIYIQNVIKKEHWKKCTDSNKEYIELNGVFSWTETGWTRCYRIIRHIFPFQKLVLVENKHGKLYCTPEHSLLDSNGNIIHYKNVDWNTELLNFKCNECKSFVYTELLQPESPYVYDLTTENNHFQAGIGSIIVHNTDSVFINFKENKEITEKLGKESAQLITKIFKKPINLEYEKYYFPFIMLSKKRYLGIKYEGSSNGKMDSKGLVINRRDSSNLLKQFYNGIVDLLMDFKKQEAIEYITEQLKLLRNNEFDLNDLQITKTYKRTDYVNQNLPHVVIAKLMESRGQSVNINDRINYIFIENGSKKNDPQYKRIEEFQFALENNIKPDIEYYIDKQLKNSIIDILSAVIGETAAKGIFGEKVKVIKVLKAIKPKKDFF